MKKPIILHIDDDAAIHELFGEAMEKAGMEVLGANSILEGIQAALAKRPNVIVLDLHMADGDGFEGCIAIRNIPELAKIPIILLTGMAGEEHKTRAFASGATEFMTKPCSGSQLIAVIKKRLAK